MNQVHIRADEFADVRHFLLNKITTVKEKFQIQRGNVAAGVAGASGLAFHRKLFIAERHIGRFDKIDHGCAARKHTSRCIRKDRIAFKFRDGHQGLEAIYKQFKQFCQNLVRMFEFRLGDERCVARNIGNHQKSVLGDSGHGLS